MRTSGEGRRGLAGAVGLTLALLGVRKAKAQVDAAACYDAYAQLRLYSPEAETARDSVYGSMTPTHGVNSQCEEVVETPFPTYGEDCEIVYTDDAAFSNYQSVCAQEAEDGAVFSFDWFFTCEDSGKNFSIGSYVDCVPFASSPGDTCAMTVAEREFELHYCNETSLVNNKDVEVRCETSTALSRCIFTANKLATPLPTVAPSILITDAPTPVPSSAPSMMPTPAPKRSDEVGLRSGEIAGIVIGAIIGFIFLVLCFWCCTVDEDEYMHSMLVEDDDFDGPYDSDFGGSSDEEDGEEGRGVAGRGAGAMSRYLNLRHGASLEDEETTGLDGAAVLSSQTTPFERMQPQPASASPPQKRTELVLRPRDRGEGVAGDPSDDENFDEDFV